MLPMTDFLFVAVLAFDGAALRTTVVALPSLVSLWLLALRPVRVAGRDAGCLVTPPPRRVFAVVAVVPVRVFAGVGVGLVGFLVVPERTALALSTMLDNTLVALAVEPAAFDFNGEPGLLWYALAGDAVVPWFTRRELDDVGESTCAGRTKPLSPIAPRPRFLAPSFSTSFSLSLQISLTHVSTSRAFSPYEKKKHT